MDHLRGHPIFQDDSGDWRYRDNNQLVVFTWHDRPCGSCGKAQLESGHDPCLGTLPGVINACCGHGYPSDAYVQFPDGSAMRGEDARLWVEQQQSKGGA
jgi:hypothetical protein